MRAGGGQPSRGLEGRAEVAEAAAIERSADLGKDLALLGPHVATDVVDEQRRLRPEGNVRRIEAVELVELPGHDMVFLERSQHVRVRARHLSTNGRVEVLLLDRGVSGQLGDDPFDQTATTLSGTVTQPLELLEEPLDLLMLFSEDGDGIPLPGGRGPMSVPTP
jgi:hypothetical protein